MNKRILLLYVLMLLWSCRKESREITEVVPASPDKLTARNITESTAELNWADNSTNEMGFIVERKTALDNFKQIAKLNSGYTTFMDKNLMENTRYVYRVYAFNQVGKSFKYSNEVEITTQESLQSKIKKRLLVYLPFSGNPNDSSGNNHDVEVNKAKLTSDRSNQTNRAYIFSTENAKFGGLQDQIYVPYSPTFNVDSFSVAIWVNPNAYYWAGNPSDPNSVILNRFEGGYSNPNSQVWGLQMNNTWLEGFILNESTANNQQNSVIKCSTIPLNKWSHVCMTFNGTSLKIYVDGKIKNTVITSLRINKQSISGISIGQSRQANGHWYNFSGKLDEVRIWDRAISEDEINYLASH